MATAAYAKGLEGIIAAESNISRIDGHEGKLTYRGYTIEELAKHSTFEEVVFLLINDHLPTKPEMDHFRLAMRTSRNISAPILEMIRAFPRSAHPMELLQSVMAYLSGYVEHRIQHSATCNCRQTLHQVSQMATVVAAYKRYRDGDEFVPPRMDLSHGANFLYMLRGAEPDPYEGSVMDMCLVLHAEHGFNASTFTARVVASTLSTCYSSISAAMGALYGPLHGGANERVMSMVEQIGTKSNAEAWVNAALDKKQKVTGMGHREYRVKDPRAIVLEGVLAELCKRKGDTTYYDILREVERVFRARMEESGKPIYPNVDFYSGAIYTLLGIPKELFTPVFAISRVAGWLAHVLEQRVDNRIFRPESLYTGPEPRGYVPIEQRS